MSTSARTETLRQGVHWVLITQALMIAIAAVVFVIISGQVQALAVVYGGLIPILSTWWLGRQVDRASHNTSLGALLIYAGAIQRFIFVMAALSFGFAVLKLSPAALLVGFILGQIAFFATAFKKSS